MDNILKTPLKINGATLKIIAIISMTIDHTAVALIPEGSELYIRMRMIGRFAFPIFCFLLSEGLKYTRNRYLYLKKLLLFGLISTPFYYLIFKDEEVVGTNVFFTLFLGGLCVSLTELISKKIKSRSVILNLVKTIIQSLVFILIFILSFILQSDYAGEGMAVIMSFYYLPLITNLPYPLICFFCCAILGITAHLSDEHIESIYAFIPMAVYDHNRGKQNKWFFYIYYPLHLLILYLLKIVLIR